MTSTLRICLLWKSNPSSNVLGTSYADALMPAFHRNLRLSLAVSWVSQGLMVKLGLKRSRRSDSTRAMPGQRIWSPDQKKDSEKGRSEITRGRTQTRMLRQPLILSLSSGRSIVSRVEKRLKWPII